MSWKVALPMYNVSARLARGYEALLVAVLDQAGLSDDVELVPDAPLPQFWRRADMLISQTCGYPYVTGLRDEVALLATPCFDLPGCHGSDYCSVLIARAGGPVRTLRDARGRVAAVNQPHSNSGMNVLRHAVAPLAQDGRFFGAVTWSGSHAASVRMVRDGEADIAAIDCVTYAYLSEEDPASVAGLAILGYLAASPGLPLVASRAVPDALLRSLRGALLEPGERLRAAMSPLRITAFEYRNDADYARIAQLEQQAIALGYPALDASGSV